MSRKAPRPRLTIGRMGWAACCAAAVSLCAAGLWMASCELAPDVGAPQTARCTNVDSDPDNEVSFASDIVLSIWPACSKCHDPSEENPLGVEIGGLDLSSHSSLLAGGVNSGTNVVVPGAPCDSVLIKKLSAGPPFGSRMPFDGPPFLSTQQVQLLSDWIAEGARNN